MAKSGSRVICMQRKMQIAPSDGHSLFFCTRDTFFSRPRPMKDQMSRHTRCSQHTTDEHYTELPHFAVPRIPSSRLSVNHVRDVDHAPTSPPGGVMVSGLLGSHLENPEKTPQIALVWLVQVGSGTTVAGEPLAKLAKLVKLAPLLPLIRWARAP